MAYLPKFLRFASFKRRSERTQKIFLQIYFYQLYLFLDLNNFNRINYCLTQATISISSTPTNSSALLKMYSACASRALTSASSAFVCFDQLLQQPTDQLLRAMLISTIKSKPKHPHLMDFTIQSFCIFYTNQDYNIMYIVFF